MNRCVRPVPVTISGLSVITTVGGGFAFRTGAGPLPTVVVAVHRASDPGLLALVPVKDGIARQGM